jgi:hypothetical protein
MAEPTLVSTIGGPHVPENVVPPRPEPFLARRQPEHPEAGPEPVTRAAPADADAPAGRQPAQVAEVAHVAAVAQVAAASPARSGGSVFSSQPASNGSADTPRAGGMGGGRPGGQAVGGVNGSAAMAADPEATAMIERDPSVNRSLLLRLIAGVRGL